MPDSCVVFARRRRIRALWRPVLLLALMLASVWWFVHTASEAYRWQWYRVWRYVGVWEDGSFTPGVLTQALGVTLELTLVSLALGLFNLLPVGPLDGGRALSCLLTLAGREDWAQPVVGLLSVGLSMGLTMGALLLWRVGEGNLTLLLVALWLSAIPLRKTKKK